MDYCIFSKSTTNNLSNGGLYMNATSYEAISIVGFPLASLSARLAIWEIDVFNSCMCISPIVIYSSKMVCLSSTSFKQFHKKSFKQHCMEPYID